ncbi:hypothetical protein Tco_0813828 [Tanacetum coccineum]
MYENLTNKEKIREACDTRAANIVLQGLPLDVYSIEKESKVYDEFDTFTLEKGETIHSYYLRYAQLINDMNTIGMSMKSLQVITKFVNHLQPEWSKFGTAVKLARDMHSTNFNQLYAYLTRSSCKRSASYEAKVSRSYCTGLVVPLFLPSDDLIASLNKEIAFISTTFASYYPQTNNQLRTSSNLRNQAVMEGVMLQVHGLTEMWEPIQQVRQRLFVAIIVKALESMAVLDEEQMEFLAANGDTVTTTSSASVVLMAKLSAYDSNVLSKVPNLDTYRNANMIDQNAMIMSVIEEISNQVAKCNEVNKENKTVNESLTAELERYKEQIKIFEERQKFKQGIAKEITDMREVFNQMETKVTKCSIDKKYFEIKNKESFIKNDRLLEHIICQDVMCIAMHADLDNKCVVPANDNHLEYAEMEQSYINECSKVLELEVELSKKKDMVEKDVYNELSK